MSTGSKVIARTDTQTDRHTHTQRHYENITSTAYAGGNEKSGLQILGNHGNQYPTQSSLTTKDDVYTQQSNYSNKYYPSNSHSNVSQRLNFDTMPSQNRYDNIRRLMQEIDMFFSCRTFPHLYGTECSASRIIRTKIHEIWCKLRGMHLSQ